MSFKRPESVLVVLFDEQSQVLVLQRNDDPGFWQSVTGTIERGEHPFQTAMREVREETGIDLISGGYTLIDCRRTNQYAVRSRWLHRYPPGTVANTEYVFCAQVNRCETITLTEHSDYLWLSKSDALEKVWSDSNRDAIACFVPDR